MQFIKINTNQSHFELSKLDLKYVRYFFETVEGDYNSYLSGKYSANEGIQIGFLYKELV